VSKFNDFISGVIQREGGAQIVNDPDDPGGVTKFGLSAKGTGMDAEEIKSLDIHQAIDIYRDQYYKPSKCDKLPERLQEAYFDTVVNTGIRRSTKILQAACNNKNSKGNQITVDGRIGPNTLKAMQNLETERFRAFRIKYYVDLVNRKPFLMKFYYGWFRRALEV